MPNNSKGNKQIAKVIIGKNIERIGAEAFSMCENIEEVIVDEGNAFFYSPAGSAIGPSAGRTIPRL